MFIDSQIRLHRKASLFFAHAVRRECNPSQSCAGFCRITKENNRNLTDVITYDRNSVHSLTLRHSPFNNWFTLNNSLIITGFYHEQARADRDKFVEVKWENILEGEW